MTVLVNNGLGQGLAFLASIAIGRALGVTGFGEFATVMALVFVATVTTEAGIEGSLTREVARDPSASRALLGASVRAKLAIGGAVTLLLAARPVAALLAPGAGSVVAVRIAGALVTLNAINSSFSAVFRAWGRMGRVLAINLAGQAVQLVGVVAVLSVARSVPAVVAWFAVVQVGELLAGAALFHLDEPSAAGAPAAAQPVLPGVGPDRSRAARALVRRSLPFALAGVLGTLEMRVDLFLVQWLRGAFTVASYSVASRLSEALGMAANAILPALYPALAAAHVHPDGGREPRLYGRALGYAVLAATAAAALGLSFAAPLVRLTFGPAYAPAVGPLRVLALTLLPALANRATTLRMYAQGRERFANAMDATSLAVRAGLGLVLVTAWGAVGAACANLAAEIVVLATYLLTGAMGRVHRRAAGPGPRVAAPAVAREASR